jgi:hypothetical protein
MYIEMFENFKKFFATKKNLYILIAALVILGGIFLLNKFGLYEGLETQIVSAPTPLPSAPSAPSSATTPVTPSASTPVTPSASTPVTPSASTPVTPSASTPVTAYKKETSSLIMSQNS